MDDPTHRRIAVANADEHPCKRRLMARGVDKAAIREASIEGARRLGLIHLPHPPNYDLWIKIEGCPKRVHIRTSYTGRLLAVLDKGGCLKGAGS